MKNIKKLLFMFLAVIMIGAFVGCQLQNNQAGKEIVITMIDQEGEELSVVEAISGEETTLEAPEKEGYAFIGWDNEGKEVTSDITITAKYNSVKYRNIFYSSVPIKLSIFSYFLYIKKSFFFYNWFMCIFNYNVIFFIVF